MSGSFTVIKGSGHLERQEPFQDKYWWGGHGDQQKFLSSVTPCVSEIKRGEHEVRQDLFQ